MDNYRISDNADIKLVTEDKQITMTWQGAVDSDNANDVLGNYLYEFHSKCKEQGITTLIINLYAVDFMNSSGIKNLISWLRDVSDENSYKAVVEYDKDVTWQDITLETFSPLIKNVEFRPK